VEIGAIGETRDVGEIILSEKVACGSVHPAMLSVVQKLWEFPAS